MSTPETRRAFLVSSTAVGTGLLLGCRRDEDAARDPAKTSASAAELEETHIFPALKRAGGAAAAYVDVLVAQHDRGREINDYVMTAAGATIGPANVEPIARVLEAFARMYEEHAAVEDTIIFPARKKTMSGKQLDEMGELFEDIEHKTFGKDGFDDAVEQITAIERAFGFELVRFTPAAPSKP
jgi:iron-sulfur cluster repair protein YtfE (RIC family)